MPSQMISLRSALLLPFYPLRVGLLNFLFPSGVSTETRYAPVLFPIMTTRPIHLILLDLITRIILSEQYQSCSSSLCSLFSSPLLPRPS